jgi:hypothetical protein
MRVHILGSCIDVFYTFVLCFYSLFLSPLPLILTMLTTRVLRPVIISALLFILFLLFSFSAYPATSYAQLSDNLSLPSLSSKDATIPNIVHYVILKQEVHSTLHMRFDHFLSIYASLMYFSPAAILLHTDHNASVIADATSNGSKWTRKILSLPNVKTNLVVPPDVAKGTDIVIQKAEHKSDFVRIDELYRTGGVYMDLDVLPLRDIKSLRNSGYKSVVGRQLYGRINNGVMMAQKGAALMELMQRVGPLCFNGGWESHSVKLITPVAERLAQFPGEVLIMDKPAFSPTSWHEDSADQLFGPHNDTSLSEDRSWEMDFSQTYLLHSYKSKGHTVPGFQGITVEYVERRDSNYALAAWPVVKHALESGIVETGDNEL